MPTTALALMLALTAGPALADPLSDAIDADGGVLCFARSYDAGWLKAHPGQTLREVKLAISHDEASNTPVMRLALGDQRRSLYGFGQCWWADGDLNRGAQDNILDPAFKPTTGVGCHMVTDISGGSAEEGAEPLIDWGDGRTIQLHLGTSLAMWPSYDIRKTATWRALKAGDRIVRLDRVKPSQCRELVAKFAPDGLSSR